MKSGPLQTCYQTCLSTGKELPGYFNYECVSLMKYNVLLCEILGLCIRADEVSVIWDVATRLRVVVEAS